MIHRCFRSSSGSALSIDEWCSKARQLARAESKNHPRCAGEPFGYYRSTQSLYRSICLCGEASNRIGEHHNPIPEHARGLRVVEEGRIYLGTMIVMEQQGSPKLPDSRADLTCAFRSIQRSTRLRRSRFCRGSEIGLTSTQTKSETHSTSEYRRRNPPVCV